METCYLSDESSFILFPTTGRICVWRTPKETYHPDCLISTVKHGGGLTMVFCRPYLCNKVKVKDYEDILGNQVHPMVRTLFSAGDAIFQDDNVPIHTAANVQ